MKAHKLLPFLVVVLTLRVKIIIRRRQGRGPVRRRAGFHPPGGCPLSACADWREVCATRAAGPQRGVQFASRPLVNRPTRGILRILASSGQNRGAGAWSASLCGYQLRAQRSDACRKSCQTPSWSNLRSACSIRRSWWRCQASARTRLTRIGKKSSRRRRYWWRMAAIGSFAAATCIDALQTG